MKKVLFFAFLATACALTSFASPGIPPVTRYNALENVLWKGDPSQPFNFNDSYEVNSYIYNSCTGEYMYYTGSLHILFKGLYNPNNNTYSSTYQGNTQGIKGVGENTGYTYQLKETYREGYCEKLDACTVRITFYVDQVFTTAGPGNNFYLTMKYDYTYNYCTYEYNLKRDIFDSGCR